METTKPKKVINIEPTKPKKVINIPSSKKSIDVEAIKTEIPVEGNPENYYQAVGVISGRVIFTKETGYKLEIGEKQYQLYFKKQGVFACVRPGEINRLLVYPRFVHFPKRDEPAQLSFQVIASETEKKDGMFGTLKDNEFLLRGVWQFIPVCQTPVITVVQNYNEAFKKRTKKLDDAKKCKLLKAIHCPLFWRDAIVPAFRYRKDSESQPDKYFVSIKARLDFKREAFTFESLLGMPTTELPNGYRVSKKMKAEVLKASKR
jgi:hypothetical protein